MIQIDRNIPNGNEAWPLSVRVTSREVRIYHDAQRDADSVSLSLDEWEKVAELIPKMLAALNGAEAAIADALPKEPTHD